MNAVLRLEQPPTREPYRFTLDDVFAMMEAGVIPAGARVELIDGVLVWMAAEKAAHMLAKQALVDLRPEIAFNVEGTLSLSAQSAPSPDFFVHLPDQRPDRVQGPDTLLIIEVSDTTLRDDLGEKADLYARHGVAEYWVLDVQSRRLTVHREPREDGYSLRRIVHPDQAVSPERLPAFTLRVADLPPFE